MSDTTAGYQACSCCDIDIIGQPGDVCDACKTCRVEGEPVPSAANWHCFTGHCDGSGCTYPGECEGAPRP